MFPHLPFVCEAGADSTIVNHKGEIPLHIGIQNAALPKVAEASGKARESAQEGIKTATENAIPVTTADAVDTALGQMPEIAVKPQSKGLPDGDPNSTVVSKVTMVSGSACFRKLH